MVARQCSVGYDIVEAVWGILMYAYIYNYRSYASCSMSCVISRGGMCAKRLV